jgi:hypothetical protein
MIDQSFDYIIVNRTNSLGLIVLMHSFRPVTWHASWALDLAAPGMNSAQRNGM